MELQEIQQLFQTQLSSFQGEIPNLIFLGKVALGGLGVASGIQMFVSETVPEFIHSWVFTGIFSTALYCSVML